MSGLLLDTHVWLWFLIGSSKLSPAAIAAIEEAKEPCWLSPLSLWELTVLVRKKRFQIEGSTEHFIARAFEALPVRRSDLDFEAARRAESLELPQQDPIDRLLAATALSQNLTLVTADKPLRAATWLPTLW